MQCQNADFGKQTVYFTTTWFLIIIKIRNVKNLIVLSVPKIHQLEKKIKKI